MGHLLFCQASIELPPICFALAFSIEQLCLEGPSLGRLRLRVFSVRADQFSSR